jgi:glutamyl-tRNA reductase
MKKILHKPSVVLRQAGEASDIALIDSARKLFDLDGD